MPHPRADAIAYLQYTSGSTSSPKGVMITHGNVLQNLDAIRRQTSVSSDSVIVGWTPMFHDMGLVGGPLNALYTGALMVFFSPLQFLKNPRLWLEAMHRYRATHTEAPNFGYEFLLRRIEGDALSGIDLSSLTHVLFGGEPMRIRTFERMAERLQPAGLRAEAMMNIFGGAEATLYMTGGGVGLPPLACVDTETLEKQGRAAPRSPSPSGTTTTFLGSRIPVDSSDVRIVDPARKRLLADGQVGEIWVSSPSVAAGYWDRPASESDAIFRARIADDPEPLRTYLRTGDLGFIDRGALNICGRRKEMMIFQGRNMYPADIEAVATSCHPAIRKGCVAAFSIEDADHEELVVVAEVKSDARRDPARASEAASAIAREIGAENGLTCQAVVMVESDSLPKTSSGKLQRLRVREAYLRKELRVIVAHAPDGAAIVGVGSGSPDDVEARLELESLAFTGDALTTRRWLQCLVATTLHIAPSDVNTSIDLLHYGLSSVRAMEMAARLSDFVGREVPPSTVLEHGSIDALVEHLCAGDRRARRALISLQRGESERCGAVFCVHPAGGSAMAYRPLVELLPLWIPVHAFEDVAEHDDVREMARDYASQMRALQPDGPYHFVGYSF
ncbi:MAG: AMP-binding protein, partial [Byssovorax sp.]